MTVTVKLAVNLGTGETNWPLLVTGNQFIPVKKKTLSWTAATFCARKKIQIYSVMFCVIRTVHKLDFKVIINETPNKWKPVESRSCSDILVFDRIYMFSFWPSSWVLRDSTYTLWINCILLSKWHHHYIRWKCCMHSHLSWKTRSTEFLGNVHLSPWHDIWIDSDCHPHDNIKSQTLVIPCSMVILTRLWRPPFSWSATVC